MEPANQKPPRSMRTVFKVILAAGLVFGCLVLVIRKPGDRVQYRPRPVPTVSSADLAKTTIVPTLDTPLAESGNVIWCATFQVAWNHICEDILDEPLQLKNGQAIAALLNNSPVKDNALPPDSYYVRAGRPENGIGETIRREMAHRFPNAQVPDFREKTGFVAYSYLDTEAAFTTPFADTSEPIEFSGSSNVTHLVNGFGLHGGADWSLLAEQADQVKVLFNQSEPESTGTEPFAFALDLTADQPEQQVIVAVLPRSKDLRATLDDMRQRTKEFAPDSYSSKLQDIDRLAIPNVAFHIDHEFAELQDADKTVENSGPLHGQPIVRAAQTIRFRLDRSGAIVVSDSDVGVAAVPRNFVVDQPFLVVMKRRLSGDPYFVAWIDNAELLEVASSPGDQTASQEHE